MKNGKPCVLILSSPKTGNKYAMSHHRSIASALRKARDFCLPYKLFTPEGKLLRSGWLMEY
jgi:hypothetical protein